MVNFFNFLLVQLNMLEEGLINHPVVGFGESGRKASELRILLAKIEESEVCLFDLLFIVVCYY
jgi:hypothetical protein